jgi:hypothetical protein
VTSLRYLFRRIMRVRIWIAAVRERYHLRKDVERWHHRDVQTVIDAHRDFERLLPENCMLMDGRVIRIRTQVLAFGLQTVTVSEPLEVC